MNTSLKKDYIWNTIGVFAQNALSPLLLVVITRINGIDVSGLFSFAFSLSIVFFFIGMWGGRIYQVSDLRYEYKQQHYVELRLILSILMMLGALIFCLANGYSGYKTLLILMLVLFKVVESIADALYGVMQVNNHLHISGVSLIVKALSGVATFTIIDLITKNIILSISGVVLINLILLIAFDLRMANKHERVSLHPIRALFNAPVSFSILRRTAGVFIVSFLALFSINIPRYFIDMNSPKELGYFGILVMPITLLALFISLIIQPNIIVLTKLYKQKSIKKFNTVITKMLLFTVAIGFIIIVFTAFIGVDALRIIFGVDFSRYEGSLLIVIAGGIANSMLAIMSCVLTIMRCIKIQAYTLITTVLVLLVVSYVLRAHYSLEFGVALFTITNFIQFVILFILYEFKVNSLKG